MSALRMQALYAGYGASTVLRGVDLEIGKGESVALVGRNGAGKSTLLMSVFRETTILSGEIWVGGARIDGLPGYSAAKLGVAISPQGRRILPNLSIRENLMLGAATRRAGRWSLRTVFDLFPALEERANAGGMMLSGGQQQMLAIGRALMANPDLLLLDEPSEGLSPVLVDGLVGALDEIRQRRHRDPRRRTAPQSCPPRDRPLPDPVERAGCRRRADRGRSTIQDTRL